MADEQEPGAREMNILLSLVNDENMTPEKAFQQIVAITEATKTQSDQIGNHCYFTASAVLEAACRNTPDKHPKIIDFIHKLRKQNVIDPSTCEALVHDREVVWKSLPTFGYTFADELNSIPDTRPTPEKVSKWENTVAFVAQLDASSQSPQLDFSRSYALTFIKSGLVNQEAKYDHDLIVRLGAIWFVHDAAKLWRKVPEEKDFSLTEWQRWKGVLEDEKGRVEDKKTKEVIEKALVEMGRVEKE